MKLLRYLAATASIVLICTCTSPAGAQEVVTNFASDITLQDSGTVDVTETIDVNVENAQIRHGIYRDIPIIARLDYGGLLKSRLDVIDVTLDGEAVHFDLERKQYFQRIRIGDPDKFVSRGGHRYTIRYTMSRIARSFETRDQLYWNATGNYWNFPILRAEATVRLPDGAVVSEAVGYTGADGSTERAVNVNKRADNVIQFTATRSFSTGEGMTVALDFQKGILRPQSTAVTAMFFIRDRLHILLPSLAVLIVFSYYFFSWLKVGRNPQKGLIIPLYYPPNGLSPALLHYLHRWGWEKNGWTAFTASIFQLGVKGLLTIDTAGKRLRLSPTENTPRSPLSDEEREILSYLKTKRSVTINGNSGRSLAELNRSMRYQIEKACRDVWFSANNQVTKRGIILVFLVVPASVVPFIADHWWPFQALVLSVAVTITFSFIMGAPTKAARVLKDQIEGFKLYMETAEKSLLNFADAPPTTKERFEKILPFAIALGVEKPWSEHFEAELLRHQESENYSAAWQHETVQKRLERGSLSSSIQNATSALSAAMFAAQPKSSSSSGTSGGSSGGGSGGGGGGGW